MTFILQKMLSLLFIEYAAFPERNDGIISKYYKENIIEVFSSGSIGQFYKGKCHQTFPNQTILEGDHPGDWCSNIVKDNINPPWITYSLKRKSMKISGYSIRAGCCYYGCCCTTDDTFIDGCCCRLYSFSLHGSNDNKTWKLIHKVEKETNIRYCDVKEYTFNQPEQFRFIKLVQDAPYPGCTHCMAINKIELYGDVSGSGYFSEDAENEETDETVSIIGRVEKKHEN